MNGSDTAGMVAGRRETGSDLVARVARVERSNARLRVGLVGAGMLVVGVVLGGVMGQPVEKRGDDIVAYTASDSSLYRIYESGRIEYLRLENDPPRSAHGVYDWGIVKIDTDYTLQDLP